MFYAIVAKKNIYGKLLLIAKFNILYKLQVCSKFFYFNSQTNVYKTCEFMKIYLKKIIITNKMFMKFSSFQNFQTI